MSFKNLEIAALLHDIGKFWQRTGQKHDPKYSSLSQEDFGISGAHSKWSASFVSKMGWEREVEDLVLHHHKPEKSKNPEITRILQKADHHSSMERVESSGKRQVRKEPLISVFSKVGLDGSETPEHYIGLKKLDINTFEDIMPRTTKREAMEGHGLEHEYKKLWNEFEAEISSLKDKNDFETILNILKKYTSFMPSAAYVSEPDISLFDHSKTTAALATCLALYKEENKLKYNNTQKTYLVISGDISGIQNFIYKISSPQEAQKGMSKRLRGRSLYLTLMNQAAVKKIVQSAGLTQANILFCGGGHFTLLAPNTETFRKTLRLLEDEINLKLFEKFGTDLYLAVSMKECSGNDLKDFGSVMDELGFENLKAKRQKFLRISDQLFEDEDYVPEDLCPVCGKEKNGLNNFCSVCEEHEELGRRIANSKYLLKASSINDTIFDFYEFGFGYKFEKNLKTLESSLKLLEGVPESLEVVKLNSSDLSDLKYLQSKCSIGFEFIGNTVPQHPPEGTLHFSHLASLSRGAIKMGVLKMDVDNLGRLFKEGLKNPTVSRISTMSSFLDIFFSGYINKVAENHYFIEDPCDECRDKMEPVTLSFDEDDLTVYRPKDNISICESCFESRTPTIYIVYSGGDDLLVLGPYDDIIKFSGDLRDKFREWTCNNGAITLSAGIFLSGSKFPIGRAVKNADNYLELSKDAPGKDSVTLFNETVKWETPESCKSFKDLFNFGLRLESLVYDNSISKGFVYSMLVLWDKTFGETEKFKTLDEGIRLNKKGYVPLFKYKLRTVKNGQIREELDREGLKFMPWIRIPASWVSLRTR